MKTIKISRFKAEYEHFKCPLKSVFNMSKLHFKMALTR